MRWRAMSYALDVGMLDAGVATDLEKRDPTPEDTAAIESFIISTGCVGHVTETSLERLLETSLDNRFGWRLDRPSLRSAPLIP